jgi:hypothetical protein
MLAPVHLRPTIDIHCKDDLSLQIKMDGDTDQHVSAEFLTVELLRRVLF